ncbi:cytochrome P450 [Serendipita vermifera]|nr:cytochrome P450 [Serendipita vermifera]
MNFTNLSNFKGTLTAKVTACCVTFIAYYALKRPYTRRLHRYPPGPPCEPLIGTLRSFPKHRFYEHFREWAQRYGDTVSLPLPGVNFLIINSNDLACEMLSRKAKITSDRTIGCMVRDLMNWGWSALFMPSDAHHSLQRKMMRRGVGSQRLAIHNELIESEVVKVLSSLKTFEGNPKLPVLKMFGRIITKMIYGERMWKEMWKDLSHWNLDGMQMIDEGFASFWIVDLLPFLRYIPEWTPGVRFKKLARESTAISNKIRYLPFKRVKELYREDSLGECIAKDLMDESEGKFDDDVRDATSILYTAGASTATGVAMSFIHTMFLFPDVAQRVYKEIESVTQGERLPFISDREKLPLTEAAWKEASRWCPSVPIGIPHSMSQDDIINGCFVPKGTVIYPNNGFILTDPRLWGDPEAFRPERFLNGMAGQFLPNPISVLSGYGRRACPGVHLADRVGFHLATTLLALYSILPLEGHKVPDPNSIQYNDGTIRYGVGFKCQFVPRNERCAELMKYLFLDIDPWAT